jgi:hypothetical protein
VTDRKERAKSGKFGPGNPGRPPGTPNKFTSLKQAFLDAFEIIGGVDALAEWAKKSERNRGIFYGLITKPFPQEVAHSGAIKTADKLIIEVVHTRPEKVDGGNGNGGNGGEKK